jgi:hypothetical protein
MTQNWIVRKAKWASGTSPAGIVATKNRREKAVLYAKMCRKGHLWTVENTILKNGRRFCRACKLIWQGQQVIKAQQRKMKEKARAKYREKLFRVHPDYGGVGGIRFQNTLQKFREAHA